MQETFWLVGNGRNNGDPEILSRLVNKKHTYIESVCVFNAHVTGGCQHGVCHWQTYYDVLTVMPSLQK